MGDITFLHLEHLSFAHADHAVFKDFSATIPAGLTIVQGDESTGKSTLLHLIAGQLVPLSGQIRYVTNGASDAMTLESKDYVLVGERAQDWDDQTPTDFFDYCRTRYGHMDMDRLEQLIQELGLKDHMGKRLFMLSRGSKRKVWLAAAFAVDAPITLMDDPFMALDHQSVVVLKKWINQSSRWSRRVLIMTQHVWDDDLKPTTLIDLNKVHS